MTKFKTGLYYLHAWGLDDPDSIGASEYRAIFETLEDALTNCEEDIYTPEDLAIAILNEFILYSQVAKKRILAAKLLRG